MSLKKVIAVIMSSNNRGNDPLRGYLALLEKESKLFNRHLICESKKKGCLVQKAIRNIIQKGAQEKADHKELFINALKLNQGKLLNKRVTGTHLTTQEISKGSDQLQVINSKPPISIKELKKLAKKDKEKQCELGQLYYDDKRYRHAYIWFLKAANQNLAEAQSKLAQILEKGQGVEKNEGEAVKWYRQAANQGNTNAQFNLGAMLLNGLGVGQDEKEAIKWYR